MASPSLDFSSYYKFKASLGLLIVAAGTGYPVLVLRSVPSTECSAESGICRSLEITSLWLVRSVPLVCVFLVVFGALLARGGLGKWRERQQMFDRREDAETHERELTVKQLSEREVEERLDEEVKDAGLPSDLALQDVPQLESGVTAPPSIPSKESPRYSAPGTRYVEVKELVRNEERRLLQSVQAALPGYEVTPQAHISTGVGRRLVADVVAKNNDELIAFELRYVARPTGATQQFARLRELLYNVDGVRHDTEVLRVVAVMAINTDQLTESEIATVRRHVQREVDGFHSQVDLVLVGSGTGDLTPDRVRRIVGSKARTARVWDFLRDDGGVSA